MLNERSKIQEMIVNPARSFGPAIFAGGKALQQIWLFMIAPVVGGMLAAVVWKGVFEDAVDVSVN